MLPHPCGDHAAAAALGLAQPEHGPVYLVPGCVPGLVGLEPHLRPSPLESKTGNAIRLVLTSTSIVTMVTSLRDSQTTPALASARARITAS